MKKNDARPTQADLVKQIKRIMQKKGLNSSKLAKIVGTSRARISHILSGTANLTLFTVGCIAESLDCNLIVRLKRRKKVMTQKRNESDERAMLVALMHNPDRTEEETARTNALKTCYYPGMSDTEIINSYRQQERDKDNAAAGIVARNRLYDETEADLMKQLIGQIYGEPKGGDHVGIAALLANEDIIKLQTEKPGETGKIMFPSRGLSCVKYRGLGDVILHAYGTVRAVTNENGTFYMVASIFTENGSPLNEIAIPKESVIHPITETYYQGYKPERG